MGYSRIVRTAAQAGRGPKKELVRCHNCEGLVKVAPAPTVDMHRCQFCSRAFCKKCGIGFACFSCLASIPDEEKVRLIKMDKWAKIGSKLGITIAWIGLIPVIALMFVFFYTNVPIFLVPPVSQVFFPCIGLIILGFAIGIPNFGKMKREVGKLLKAHPEMRREVEQAASQASKAPKQDSSRCPNCGGTLSGNTCYYCNARICQNCGKHTMSGDATTCPHCGVAF